jgi:NitT/TauT family transport system ATP-binding protein
MKVVTLKGVSKAYNGAAVVRDLSLEITSGEIVALLGQTGAGKSTILNMIMGQTAPSSGEVRINGSDPRSHGQDLRGFMAVSFQTDRLLPWRTAELGLSLGRG